MKFLWISLLIGFASGAGATTLQSYSRNKDGLKKFGEKSYHQAFQEFSRALEDDPLNPLVHLNIARAFEANEEFEKAEQGYKGILKVLPENSDLRFQTLFNLAGVQTKGKKIEEALATYQAALALNPESIEVKTNIELLWQGGGEGEGDGDPNKDKDKDDKKGKGKGDQPDDKSPPKKEKQQPKPFNSQELSPQDVKKILDEIKNQEQAIRAEENDKGAKQAQPEKDW